MKKYSLLFLTLVGMVMLFMVSGCGDTDEPQANLPTAVFDRSNNQYAAITIGNQVWLNENLRTTRFNNGDNIPSTDNASVDISGQINPKYQWIYFEGSEPVGTSIGRLYTWHVVNDPRGICPPSFRVATEADWNELNAFLGGDFVVNGGKLKLQGTALWEAPNQGATNQVGFNGLPSGLRQPDGVFSGFRQNAFIWTTNSINSSNALAFTLTTSAAVLGTANLDKNTGAAVRCIKEN